MVIRNEDNHFLKIPLLMLEPFIEKPAFIVKCPVESSFVLVDVGLLFFMTELLRKARFDVKLTDFLKNLA